MSLNAVFLVFMDFDIFRNVSLIHQGIYSFRIRRESGTTGRILFYESNPCIKSNIRNNVYIEDAELYYKPCNVDVDNGTFVSRSILIRYSGEEASLRDSCCWRIEVPYEDINDSSLSFTVELYSHCPIQSDKRVSAYAEKPTLLGTQSITIKRLSSDSSMSYIHLLFPDQGLCEITGVLMCSLVDMRFSHSMQDDEQTEHVTSADTLFGDCDSFIAMTEKAATMKNNVSMLFETSYYHIINCIQSIELVFVSPSNHLQQYNPSGETPSTSFPPFFPPSL